ncbi:MAG: MATE family efflux transporter [Halobacteriovoraceae bacterium]|nr:MATE family efflux transporter [Halobacteriovoraceae bacterium]
MKKDYTYKFLIVFSLPSIFSSMLEPLASVVDTALVGHIETSWLAALAVGTVIFSSITWIFNFLVHASTQTVAVSRSKDNWQEFGSKVKLSCIIAITIGITISAILYFFKLEFYQLLGTDPSLYSNVDEYFHTRLIGQVFIILYITLLSILRGMERVTLSFWIVIFTTLLNVIISYMALYAFNFGLKGVAFGTVVSHIIGALICFLYLLSNPQIRAGIFGPFHSKEEIFTFGKNSWSMFGRSFFLTSAFLIGTRVAASIGVLELAAHQVMTQLWLLSSFFIDGVAITGNVVGAGHFAHKRYDIFLYVAKKLLVIGLGIGILFLISYLFGLKYFSLLFTKDPKVIELLKDLCLILALSQIHNALAFVLDGIIFGAEGFSYLRKHMFIGFVFIFIPLIYAAQTQKSLAILWFAHCALNFYRLTSGGQFLRKISS